VSTQEVLNRFVPGRRSRARGRWSVARAPVTRWTDCDRGPQADAEERITSAHRAIEIREKRRRVLLSRPAWNCLALQPTSSVNGDRDARCRPVDAQNAPFGAASIVIGRRITTYRSGGSVRVRLVARMVLRPERSNKGMPIGRLSAHDYTQPPSTGNDLFCRWPMRALPVIAERVSAQSQGLPRG
jgi:hypothetical protein